MPSYRYRPNLTDPRPYSVVYDERQSAMPAGKGYYSILRNPFLRHIWNRCHFYNQNWMWMITGAPGTGKSQAGLWNAKMLDPNFSIDRVAFSLIDFLRIINRADEMPKGSAILFEEVGINLDNRKWQSVMNEAFVHVAQVMRTFNHIIIYTAPNMEWMDKKGRELLHCVGEMSGIDRGRNVSKMRVETVSTNPKTGKKYFKYPRVVTPSGRKRMKYLLCRRVDAIDPRLYREYEEKRHEYGKMTAEKKLKEIISSVKDALEEQTRKDGARNRSKRIREIAEDLKENPDKGVNRHGKWVIANVRHNYNVSHDVARAALVELGVDI